ncbi:hypothetical protein [Poritiphilus flavus]|uniref:Uncharacterized protein n=1 Tax=Poritiphilus flavus TaxID=2697053 RepID=A0A6L9EEY4_9FLAO|nr:hypothetical protein [Poritiphilus flavus]NAS13330.1 hypothetical protein [Poritiphilus flavus]
MKKFTLKEIEKKVGKKDKDLVEKVFLLANGMIDVHGFDHEKAYNRALDIAREWHENGGKYKRQKF